MTAFATVPIKKYANTAPPGPAIFRTLPDVRKRPMPIALSREGQYRNVYIKTQGLYLTLLMLSYQHGVHGAVV